MSPAEIDTAADALIDGTLDEAGRLALEAALRGDAALRRRYARVMRQHQQVRGVLLGAAGGALAGAGGAKLLSGPVVAVAVGAVVVAGAVALFWSTPSPLRIVSLDGPAVIGQGAAAAGIGDALRAPDTLRTTTGGAVLSDGDWQAHLAAQSAITSTEAGLSIDEGELSWSSAAGGRAVILGGTPITVVGGGTASATPWGHRLALDGSATADQAGLPPGGRAVRTGAHGWLTLPAMPVVTIGEARVSASAGAAYQANISPLPDSAVVEGPTWRPTAAVLSERARRLGGDLVDVTTDGKAVRVDAPGAAWSVRHMPIGPVAGGLVMRMRLRFVALAQLPADAQGPGNSFDLDYGVNLEPPIPGAPAGRTYAVLNSGSGELASALELRVLPVAWVGDSMISEVVGRQDGQLAFTGWLRGSRLELGVRCRGGAVELSQVAIAMLWDTPPAPGR